MEILLNFGIKRKSVIRSIQKEKKVLVLAFEKLQLLQAILNRSARGPGARSWKALLGPIPRLCAVHSLISSHSMPLPWGRSSTSRVSQGQDKPPCAWNHNPPTWVRTAGKLLTINKHRCAIITGCLLRYQDRLSFPNMSVQKHCGWATVNTDPLWSVDIVSRALASLSSVPAVWD